MENDNHPTFSFKATKRLIQMVQERACLWDKSTPEYKDRLAKDKAWSEIFHELDPSFETANNTMRHEISISIQKKWYNIRDSYVKSMKTGYLGRRNRPYIHAELLKFLDGRYFDKKRYIQNEEEPEQEPWDHEVFVSIDETEDNSAKRAKVELSPVDNLRAKDNEEDIVTVLSNLIQKEEDEDRAFFKSITPSVKQLSEDSKFEFRIEVLKLIKSLRLKDKNRLSLKTEKVSNHGSDSD